jgi:hypothetical protein
MHTHLFPNHGRSYGRARLSFKMLWVGTDIGRNRMTGDPGFEQELLVT